MLADESYDYIIVGAGILGCATAKHLQDNVGSQAKILLVDKYLACGQGNTGKSNACYRNVFDTLLNIQLCSASISFYRYLEQVEKVDVGLKEFGYLWLLNERQMIERTKKTIKVNPDSNEIKSLLEFLDLQKVHYKIFNQEEVKNLLPQLQVTGEAGQLDETIVYGLLGYQCGSLTPDLLVKYYESDFKNNSGECLYGYEIQKILLKEKGKNYDEDYFPTVWRTSEVAGIKAKNIKTGVEKNFLTKNLVLCTGAWANQLLYPLGIHIGMNAKKRQLFRLKGKKDFVVNTNFHNSISSIPFIILPQGGVFIKPIVENGCVDVGCSDDIGRKFEFEPQFNKDDPLRNILDNPQGEIEFYQTDVLPILQKYFPGEFTEKIQVDHPSAGMYAYTLDKFPVITKELGNLYICTGASGSGIMKANSIAQINVANILGRKTCKLFDGSKIEVEKFSLHKRNLPQETLIL